jgi:hypothetical protein
VAPAPTAFVSSINFFTNFDAGPAKISGNDGPRTRARGGPARVAWRFTPMDAVFALVELALWFICLTQKPQTPTPSPARRDDWTPPTTEEIARAIGWPKTAPANPLYDRELDG